MRKIISKLICFLIMFMSFTSITLAKELTPVEQHGKLSVKGTSIVDKNGQVFQLRGVSTHGISWFPQYVNQETISLSQVVQFLPKV